MRAPAIRQPILRLAVLLATQSAVMAASQTWLNTGGTNGNWNTGSNWLTGAAPGSTVPITGINSNNNVATFNTAVGNFGTSGSPIVIDSASQNIKGITFDTTTGNYFIGATSGNPLYLSTGGSISILSTLTATNAVETINAPLVIEGASGTYTFQNASTNGSVAGAGTLNIAGQLSGGNASAQVVTLNGANTNLNTISGAIIDGTATSLSITKAQGGKWVLTGANTFTGLVSANNGTLTVNSISDSGANALGLGAQVNLGSGTTTGGTLDYNSPGSSAASTSRMVYLAATTTGGGTISNNSASTSATLTVTSALLNASTSGSKTFTLQGTNAGANVFQSLVSDGGNGGVLIFVKDDAGFWTLSGANTFTGDLRINAGTLNLSTINDVTVASNAGAGNLIRLGASNSTGTLNYTGSGSTTNRQTQIGNGTGSTADNGGIITNNSGGPLIFTNPNFNVQDTGLTATLARNLTLQGTNTGVNEIQGIIQDNVATGGVTTGAIIITKGGAGTWTLSGLNSFTGDLRINQGIFNVATINNATVASNAGAGTLIRLSNANTTGILNYTGSGNTTNRQVQVGNGTVSTNLAGGTIQSNGSGALIFTNASFNQPQTGVIATGARVLLLKGANSGPNEIQGMIQDNLVGVSGTPSVAVAKSDAGRWILSGTNTYTGGTTVSGGVLVLNSSNALPGGVGVTGGTSGLTFNGGVIGLASEGFARTVGAGVDQVQWNASVAGGFAAFGSDRNVNLGGASAVVTWQSAGPFGGSALLLGHATADKTVDFQNPIDLSSAVRTVQVDDGSASIDGILSGGLSGVSSGLTKTGNGTLQLAAANSFTSTTTISAGTLNLTGSINMTSGVTVTGNLHLAGAAGEQVKDSANIDLAGGRLAFTDGASQVETIGILSLIFNSVLDYSSGTSGNDALFFAGVGTHSPGATLTIDNWRGNPLGGDGAGGDVNGLGDRLLFAGNSSAFTTAFNQADVNFIGFGSGYAAIPFGGRYEIVPVPEPGARALLSAVGFLAFASQGRRRGLRDLV